MLNRRPVRPLLLFALICAFGTIGYMIVEGWSWLESLWMVLITFTTIGYGEVKPLSDAGRVYTIVLIFGGISVFSYALTQVSFYMLEGGLRSDIKERKQRRLMAKLRDHFIVAGYGRLGSEVTEELLHHGCQVVVIDDQEEAQREAEGQGVSVITGDASRDEILIEAGVERARGLAVATSSNAVNILVTLSAHQLNPDLMILTRVEDQGSVAKAKRAGATTVIVPHGLAGVHMAHGLLRPEARNFLTQALTRTYHDLTMEDIQIRDNTAMHGTLRDLKVRARFNIVVVAIRKAGAESLTMPGPDTVLNENDVVVVIGRPEDIDDFASAASAPSLRSKRKKK